jgi:hypothetical protein
MYMHNSTCTFYLYPGGLVAADLTADFGLDKKVVFFLCPENIVEVPYCPLI